MMRIGVTLCLDYGMPKPLRDDRFFGQTRLKQIIDPI